MHDFILLFLVAFSIEAALGQSCNDDITISKQSDADNYNSCEEIKGDVTISSNFSGDLTLDNLAKITGDFTCTNVPGLTTFSAPSLKSVAGSMKFKSAKQLTSLEISALNSVGELELQTLPKLNELRMTSLTELGDGIINNSNLTDLAGFSPETVGTFTISGNRNLKTVAFSDFSQASGTLNISSNSESLSLVLPLFSNGTDIFLSGVNKVYMDSLEGLTGNLSLVDSTLDTFAVPKLADVGQVKVMNNPGLNSVDFSDLVSVDEDLDITGNGNLSSVKFPKLQSIGGDVEFEGINSIHFGKIETINGIVNVTGSDSACSELKETHYAQIASQFICKSSGNATLTSASSDSSNDTNGSSGLSTGARAGVGVGVALGVLIMVGVGVFLYLRMRRERKNMRDEGAIAGVNNLDQRRDSPSNFELDGNCVKLVEAPGTKDQLAAELPTRAGDNAVELRADKGGSRVKNGEVRDPAELE